MMTKYCPHCKEEIGRLDCEANYSETVYGSSTCYYDIDDECEYNEDQSADDSDNFEEYDYKYTCPECDAETCPDDLLNELEDEEPVKPLTVKERMDAFNKLNQAQV